MVINDEHPIRALIRHCKMYLYGSKGSPELLVNDTAQDFYTFALLHLTSTMFITTDPPDNKQGIFHRILDPLEKADLLLEIDTILDSKLGDTMLRQFIRSKRNKLTVHGNVAFSSQPIDVQNVSFDDISQMQFSEAMTELDDAMYRLIIELEKYASELGID